MAITKIEVPELFDFGSDNSAFKLPTGTTAERPTSPSNGEMRFNTTTGYVEYYDTTDAQWWEIDYASDPIVPSDNFNTVLYTGTGSGSKSVTGVGFQPDLVWGKATNSGSLSHILFDAVRGENKQISSDLPAAQVVRGSAAYEFDSDGFTVTTAGNLNNSNNFVAWCWKAGGAPTATNSGGQTPTLGSKMVDGVASTANFATSTSYPLRQSVNSSTGFSITTITKSATNIPLEVPHGLNSPPELIMLKTTSTSDDWNQWQTAIGTGAYLSTNRNGGTDGATAGAAYNFTVVNNDIIRNQWTNAIRTWVCYAWHSVAGYSKMGSYVGNGSNTGTVVDTGFEPAWVMIKSSSSYDGGGGAWLMYDNKRSTSNPRNKRLYANYNYAEATNSNYDLDFLTASPKGFQPKYGASSWGFNTVNVEYIYMAFAVDPT